MMDPYSVLGVSRTASSDEIKKEYRRLSRIYHPDANVNNPNKAQAEERFKQIQEAYNQIMNERENGGSSTGNSGYGSSSYGYGYSSGFGGQANYSNDDSAKLRAATNYINAGHYAEAYNVLESMPVSERSARWYYLHSYCNVGMGNMVNASQDARTAVSMEPGNQEYEMLYNRLNSQGGWYQNTGSQYGGMADDMGSCCTKILCFECLAQMCCCCGGGY